jgi:hypothetical protein
MADNETAEENRGLSAAKPSTRRKPGTGFPVVSLAEASEVLKTAGKYGFEHSVTAFAKHMGHSTTNSGAFRQRLAAFRDWNLIAGRGESVSMTEIARIIALPPDDDAERAALEAAFRNCAIFLRLYEESRKNVALARPGIGNRAVHDFGVAPASASKFVDSFVESIVAARLGEVVDDDQVMLLEPVQGDEPDPAAKPVIAVPGAAHTRVVGGTRAAVPVVHQSWPIDGGTIVFEIRCEKPLPAAAYSKVGEVVASLERLSETLAPTAPGSQPSMESTE